MMSLKMLGLFFLQLVFTLVTSSLKMEHTWSIIDSGPRENETGRFLYSDPTQQNSAYHVCKFCEKKALDDGSYQHYQEPLCFLRYYPGGTFNNTLMTSKEETVQEKLAFCNRGETPGCGPPPGHYNWSCSFGYTVTDYYSVYSYCRRYCTWSPDLKWELYCNESLLWEIVEDPGNKCFEPPVQKTDTPVNTIIIAVAVSVASVMVIIIVIVFRKKRRCRKRRNSGNVEAIPLQTITLETPAKRTKNQAYNMEPTAATETELSEDAVAETLLLVRQDGESDDGSYARAMDITDSKTSLKSSQTETSSDLQLDGSASEHSISACIENKDVKERYTASEASGGVELHISDNGNEKDVEMGVLDKTGDESLTGAIGGLKQIGDTSLKEFKRPGRNMNDLPVTHAGHSKFISDGENLYIGLRNQVEHEALGNYLTNENADLAHPVPPLMEDNQVNSAVESNRTTQDTLFASIANADASREVINQKGADVILIVDQGKIEMTNSDKKYAIQVPKGDTIYVYPVNKQYVSFEITANSTVRSKKMWVQEKSIWRLVGVTLEDTGMYTWKLSYLPECGLPDKVGHFKLLCQSEERADPSGRVTTFVPFSQPLPHALMRNIPVQVAQVNGFHPVMTGNQNLVPTNLSSAPSANTNNPCTVISNDTYLSLVRPETSGCDISIEQFPATNNSYKPLNIESFSSHSSAGSVNRLPSVNRPPIPLNQDTQLSHSLPRLDVQSLLNDSNSHSHINRDDMQLMNRHTGLDEPGIPLEERLPPIGCEHNEEVVESRHSQSSSDSDSEMENLHYTEVKQLHITES